MSQPHRVSAGKYKRIYDPSVGENETWYINDHCCVRDAGGTWHLIGITHPEPANALEEKALAHATANSLLQPQWQKQPFALTAEAAAGERHLWAPHVVFHDGHYWMFYCAGGESSDRYRIHLATSPDLRGWTRHNDNPLFTDGYDARDPCVIRVGDQWVMYYCANSTPQGGSHIVACRTSRDLVHWGERRTVFTCRFSGTWGGGTESPFVLGKDDWYYLFIGPRSVSDDYDYMRDYNRTQVFASQDPLAFNLDQQVGQVASHAAEVVQDVGGRWYISHCGWGNGGVYLAELRWE